MKQIPFDRSRRQFLKNSSLFAFGASIAVGACKNDKDVEEIEPAGQCRTADDILGPFYKAGAPMSENIIPYGNNSEALLVQGSVLHDCDKPIANAAVEIWNADENGVYDVSENYFFRGRFETGVDGVYRFRTIIPGRYLNGSTYRPSHIHFRITAPGFQELVSQIYFKEDPFIPSDPWASADKAKDRILPVSEAEDGSDLVNFDIHLNRTS
jgi:catechol 1,2-dioxygenase